jgi:hypothetical protein
VVGLVIPAVAFVAVASLLMSFSLRQAVALGEAAEQVALGRQVTALVHELQAERDWTAGVLAQGGADGDEQLAEPLAGFRDATDEAMAGFEVASGPLRARPGLAGGIAAAGAALAELDAVRAGVDEGWLHELAVFDGYSRAVGALLELLQAPPEAAEQTGGLRELAEAKELRSQVRGLVHAVTGAGRFRLGEASALVDILAQHQAAAGRFQAAAAPAQVARFDAVVRGQAVATTARLEAVVLEQTDAVALEGVDPQRWWSAATTELELVREVETALLADVLGQLDRAGADQWQQTWLVIGVSLAILVLSVATSAGIGRSMGLALRRLHAQAMDVAQAQLPELLSRLRNQTTGLPSPDDVAAVSAGGADEVGDVADAFTQVHRAAVGLAVEQARMRRNVGEIFVHLARRSQILVERQLEVLDALEQNEVNHKRLADLFRIDHLATRQRRTNDSLLVLAGVESVRGYEEPVPLASIIQAAIAEIEQLDRIQDRVDGEVSVVGHALTDLVHLLAELLDNATSFSEPHTAVTVQGYRQPEGQGAVVAITDFGPGMSASALGRANRLLADPPPIDVAASEQMGLVVVGHLAARHRIHVYLEAATPGVQAMVWLPETLLTATVPRAAAQRVDPQEGPRSAHAPVRAEDVLGPRRGAASGNAWWARPNEQVATPLEADAAAAPGSPSPPPALALPADAGRITAAGLPVRVPLAQVPGGSAAVLPGRRPGPVVEQDPDQAGGALSALYDGVRRAEAEFDSDEAPTQVFTRVQEGP